ncbi:MAG: ABC transporter permease, partial [Verrucomicrobiales bacterium]|nr:ABC transporter permease [Verrucomicrobiales bacterium]
IRKEFLVLLRDKRSRILLVAPTLLQMVIFSFAATLEVKNVTIGILNHDTGQASRELVERFRGSPTFRTIEFLESVDGISGIIDSQSAIIVMHIPGDFSRRVAAGRPAEVQFILDGRRSNAAQIVQGYALSIVNDFNGTQPVRLVARNWFNPNLSYTWYTVPSLIGILATVNGLIVTGLSVARERELGTFEQLLVSPLSRFEILLGKTIPAYIIAWVEGVMILGVAVFVFRVPFNGSVILLIGGLSAFLFSIVSFGLLVSALANTQQQAVLGTFVFMIPAMIISGFASPVENMPDWLQLVAEANPLKHFLIIVKGVFLKDMSPALVAANTWPILVIAACTLVTAAALFRSRMA